VARFASVPVSDLDQGLVLAPERYDPTRRSLGAAEKTIADVARLVSDQINGKTADASAQYLILDTGDAREGIVVPSKDPVGASDIRSSKKSVEPGDLIISRLRPYLRQVAVVDSHLWDKADHVVCSTEFYVLRGKMQESLVFLAPWLLSEPVQAVLAAAQEGGHHPRFHSDVLCALPVPDELWSAREATSALMEQAIQWKRQSERAVLELVEAAGSQSG
jgi:hypothetical protein